MKKKVAGGAAVLVLSILILLFLGNKYQSVVGVIDGDTIKLEAKETVRLIGIDTPEEEECFAEEATQITKNLVLNKKVRLEFDKNTMDHFGRKLAYVFIDGLFLNQKLLEEGAGKFFLDTVNTKYQQELIAAANLAHEQKKGLWQKCAADPKAGCNVKGNYDIHGHRYYHLPEFRHYSVTKVNLENGDQWFCSEEEAQKAGFTKARE